MAIVKFAPPFLRSISAQVLAWLVCVIWAIRATCQTYYYVSPALSSPVGHLANVKGTLHSGGAYQLVAALYGVVLF